MRQRFVWLAAILLFASVAHAEEPQKYALLVGVTKYRHSRMNDAPLKYPEADAAAIGEMLKASGYAVEILLGEKATQQAVQAALAKAGRQGNTGGVLVVGLFGHGVQYGEDAYFGPYDTTVREVTDAQGNALRKNGQIMLEPDPASMVDMKSILDALTKCGASHKVILADCCREDPSTARGRAFGSQLRVADLPSGTAALFACSANEQAFEHDDWGHGAFSKALLDHAPRMAADEGVTANELSVALYRTVSLLVRDKTSGSKRQTVNPIINGVVDLRLVTDGPEYLVGSRAGELREFSVLKIKFCWCPPGEFEFRAERFGGLRRAEGSFPTRKITPASNSVWLTRGFWLCTFEV
ncbi:MAG: caspase domain-containing protein, partial [Planctomycetaceae bacterium]